MKTETFFLGKTSCKLARVINVGQSKEWLPRMSSRKCRLPCTFVPPISFLYIFLGGKQNCLHPKSIYNKGNVLLWTKYYSWKVNFGGNIPSLFRCLLHRTPTFHISTENGWTSSVRYGYRNAWSGDYIFFTIKTIHLHIWKITYLQSKN